MDAQEFSSLQEAYLSVYSQVISESEDEDDDEEEMKEGYDFFDVILEHLVAEGYADTNEAALAIMANMSEEWRENIVEELTGARRERVEEKAREYQPHNRRRKATDAAASTLFRVMRDREGSRIGKGKHPTKRGGYGEKGKMKTHSLGGDADRGEGNKAARRAGKSVQDTRGDED